MGEYRLYCLDARGHILQRTEFQANGDDEAIAHLKSYDPDTDRELWQERRKVVLIPAQQVGLL